MSPYFLCSQLNKAPPAPPPANQRRNYSTSVQRPRATFTLYQEDSSEEDSTETESDASSDESSDDARNKPRVANGGYRSRLTPQNLNTRKNGAITSNNFVRASSAKVNDSGKRSYHTQRTVKPSPSPVGNVSYRSVKSESAIAAGMSKAKVENRKPPLPKVPSRPDVKEAFTDDANKNSTADRETKVVKSNLETKVQNERHVNGANENKLEKEQKDNSVTSEKPCVSKKAFTVNSEQAKYSEKKDNVAKDLSTTKYDKDGSASSLDKDITEPTAPVHVQARSPHQPSSNNVAISKVLRARQALLESKQKPSQTRTEETDHKDQDISIAPHRHTTIGDNNDLKEKDLNANDQKQNILPKQAFESCVDSALHRKNLEPENENEKIDEGEREAVLHKYGISPLPGPKTADEHVLSKHDNQTLDSPIKSIKTIYSDSAIASGYFVDDGHIKSTVSKIPGDMRIAREKPLPLSEPRLVRPKTTERTVYKPWHEGTLSTQHIVPIVNDANDTPRNGSSSRAESLTSQNSNSKSSKILSEKTAKSFAKYAHLTDAPAHKKKKRHGKKRKITLKDKPSPGSKHSHKRTELNSVNAVPYGYSNRANKVKGVGPFRRTSVRTLSSAIDYSDFHLRSGSAEIPKISYRHKLETPTRPVNMAGPDDLSRFSTPVDRDDDPRHTHTY